MRSIISDQLLKIIGDGGWMGAYVGRDWGNADRIDKK
jgi:hypothetical protein